MSKNSISFLTPLSKITSEGFRLEKKYSGSLTLKDGSSISFASDIGHKDNQEDSLAICYKDNATLLLVSDGMGGIEFGELASYTIAKTILEWFESQSIEELKELSQITLKNKLLKLLLLALMYLPKNSGTTLNMSIILPEYTLIVNVGDSRTYTIKNGDISLGTKDDSLAFNYFNPTTTEERDKLRFYKQNNIITKAITPSLFPKLTVTTVKNDEYDTICHVTDGVSDILMESEINDYCCKESPASTLIEKSVYQPDIYWNYNYTDVNYHDVIHPGQDNSTAIVYTKKRQRITTN